MQQVQPSHSLSRVPAKKTVTFADDYCSAGGQTRVPLTNANQRGQQLVEKYLLY